MELYYGPAAADRLAYLQGVQHMSTHDTKTLTFSLPGEAGRWAASVYGPEYLETLRDLDRFLYARIHNYDMSDEAREQLRDVRCELHSLLDTHNAPPIE